MTIDFNKVRKLNDPKNIPIVSMKHPLNQSYTGNAKTDANIMRSKLKTMTDIYGNNPAKLRQVYNVEEQKYKSALAPKATGNKLIDTFNRTGQIGANVVMGNKETDPSYIRPIDTGSKKLNTASNIIGGITGFAGASALPGTTPGNGIFGSVDRFALNGVNKLAPKLNPLGKTLIKGGVAGGVTNVIQGDREGDKLSQAPKNLLVGVAGGSILEGAGYGIGKTIAKYLPKGRQATTEELDNIAEQVAKEHNIPTEEARKQVAYHYNGPENPLLANAEEEYNNAIETIQNHFGTHELRSDEIPLIKSELGIDLDSIVGKLAKAEKATPEEINAYKQSILDKARMGDDLGVERRYNPLPKWVKESSANTLESKLPKAQTNLESNMQAEKGFGQNTVGSAEYSPSMEYGELPASKFRTNTLERSLPEEAKKNLNLEDFDYVKESKKEWQDEALHNIMADREKVFNDIKNSDSISSGGVKAYEAAILSHDLLEEAQKTSDYSKYKSFLQTVADRTRESARNLKATDLAWDKISADGAVLQAQRVVNKAQRDLEKTNPKLNEKIKTETKAKLKELTDIGETPNYDDVRNFVLKKYKIPTLEDTDIQIIVDRMNKSKQFPEGSYEQRRLVSEAKTLIANKEPSDFIDKFKAAQRISMLTNPKSTLVRNPLGNTLLGTLEDVKNIPATVLDKAISLKTGKRTTTFDPFTKGKASLKGAGTGLKEWALDLKNGVDTSPTGGQADLPEKTKIFLENNIVGKAGNKVHSVVSHMLQLGDRPFYQGAYESRLAELKKINKTDIVTDAMKQEAREHALERTLQNDSWISNKLSSIGADKSDPVVWRVFVNLIMPFKKTPANILDKFIDYSGVGGLAKSVYHVAKTAGKGTFNQRYFVDTMGRSLTGTGLSVLGYLLAKNGIITGARDNNNKISGIETALGKQNYAYKIGDTYHTYDWALPASAPIALGADFYYAQSKAKDGQNAYLKGTESAVNSLFNSTLLQGPSKLMSGYSPAIGIGQSLLNSSTQATPTIFSQTAKLIDPYQRETYDPNPLKQALNKSISKIPFASENLPIKQDVFGNDVEAYQGKNNAFNVMFNPGFDTTYEPNNTQKEIMRLYEESGQTDQLPAVVEKYIDGTKTHPRINLTSEEYVQYQKQTGQKTTQQFEKIMSLPGYSELSDQDKANVLNKIVKDAKQAAKDEIVKARGYDTNLKKSKFEKAQDKKLKHQKDNLFKQIGE